MANRSVLNIKRYHGLAGIIRRKMVYSIVLALAIGEVAILLGVSLRESELLEPPSAYAIVGLLFLLGLFASAWLMLRLMNKPLRAIQHVEDSLVQVAREDHVKKDQLIEGGDGMSNIPLVQAFYGMIDHMDVIETERLNYLAKVSHEIRSPMATILGYTELLGDADIRQNEDFFENCYQIINKEGKFICRLVEDAVLAAGIDADHYHYDFTLFDLNYLLESLLDELRKQYKREILYDNKFTNVKLEGDILGIREAIRNIIDNGLKYSPEEKPVIVSVRQGKDPRWIEIAIRDYGIGIEEKDQRVLFRRFLRLNNAQTSSIPGSGLGLYIANKIIQNHHGSILIDSKLNHGSTFTILLPLDQKRI